MAGVKISVGIDQRGHVLIHLLKNAAPLVIIHVISVWPLLIFHEGKDAITAPVNYIEIIVINPIHPIQEQVTPIDNVPPK
jgi:hypothetical protein|tara:strand:+ start:213 stop:452 length:240 start_codon:yes stop_codon:yes gene_type:complete